MSNTSNIVFSASQVAMRSTIRVKGNSEYTITSNFISWGENCHQLSEIAPKFGTPKRVDDSSVMRMCCGDATISVFDFGLLYSVFCAMRQASIELGESFSASSEEASVKDVHTLWIGNELILYSVSNNLILPVTDAEVKTACASRKVELASFADTRKFLMEREGRHFVISTDKQEFFCRVPISDDVRRSYLKYFKEECGRDIVVDDPSTPWDESSPLGALVSESVDSSTVTSMMDSYRTRNSIDSIVNRKDLIITPCNRYTDFVSFPGSVCYTDRKQIALAINNRENLFVFRPWFDGSGTSEIQVYANPDYSKFYDITEECRRIEAFARTVVCRPLKTAEFDLAVFTRIKNKFFAGELKRLPLASAFGKMIIPEKVLLREVSGDIGETIYFAVPVGIVDDKVICINPEGNLEAIPNTDFEGEFVFMEEN